MKADRLQTWLIAGVVGAGLFVAAIFGLFAYMSLTAKPLHPNAQDVPSVPGAASSPEWNSAAEQARHIIRAHLAAKNLPGLSVAVGAGADIVWAEGFGFADLENRVRVEPGTRFRIGTASKALTSAAAGLLVERGQLNLDQKIQTYVPQFPQKPWPVTVRQLMAHVAGVRNDGGDESPIYGMECGSPVDGIEPFKDRDLLFEPGTEYRYSNYGWILVSAAIEAAARQPFLTFMRKQVFEPLGMDDTRDESATMRVPNMATPYFPKFAADPRYGPDLNRAVNLSCYAGASVFLSTPSDLVRFATALNGGKLLRPATVQLLQTSHRLPSGQDTGYGLGWDLETATLQGQSSPLIGHDGDMLGGMVSSLMTFPEHGLVVALTSNIAYADTHALGIRIAEAFAASQKR